MIDSQIEEPSSSMTSLELLKRVRNWTRGVSGGAGKTTSGALGSGSPVPVAHAAVSAASATAERNLSAFDSSIMTGLLAC
jgi:hypothetical protein